MAGLITLRCPSCGANVRFAQGTKAFTCDHCGNAAVLEGSEPVLPVRYTVSKPDWLRVGEYEVRVHEVLEEMVGDKRLIYINVEYGNRHSNSPISCRRNQWLLFDLENYSYEAQSTSKTFYEDRERPYFGGDRFLNRGMNARGWLAFQIPAAAQPKRLHFFTNFLTPSTVDILLG